MAAIACSASAPVATAVTLAPWVSPNPIKAMALRTFARLSPDRYVGDDDAVDRNLGLTGEQRDRHLVGGCRAHRSLEDLPLVPSHALTDRHPVARQPRGQRRPQDRKLIGMAGAPILDPVGIAHRLPWWLAGPGVGLCVVALYVLGNMRLGVSGSWLQALAVVRRQRPTEPWRLWFLAGLVGGVLVAAGLGTVHLHGYGALGSEVAPWALVVVLAAARPVARAGRPRRPRAAPPEGGAFAASPRTSCIAAL